MTKQEKISENIKCLIDAGVNPIEALRKVCGAALVDDMISRLYDELRKS